MIRVCKGLACGFILMCVLPVATYSQPAPAKTVEPIPGQLAASDGKKSNELGYSVSIAGDTAVLGAPYATIRSKYARGAAYVFVRSADGWKQTAKLTASDAGTNSFFGSSVSISGDTIVVGADGANLGEKQAAGAAYVFVKPANGWTDATQTAKLMSSDLKSNSYFGSSVSIRNDVIAIGADGAAVGANPFQGAIYLYRKPGKVWVTTSTCSAKLIASDGAKGDQLGYSVSISEDSVVAGARSAQVAGNAGQGAAYLFVKPAAGWANANQTSKLVARDGAKDDQFGSAVSIDGDIALVGAPGAGQGAAYVFVKPGSRWSQLPSLAAKLTSSDVENGKQLGAAVEVRDSLIAVGAPLASTASAPQQGAIYVFTKSDGGWATGKETFKIVAQNGKTEDRFGASLDIEGQTVLVGAPGATLSQKYQGAAYVFDHVLDSRGADQPAKDQSKSNQ